MFDSTIGKKYIMNYLDLLPGDIILESGKRHIVKQYKYIQKVIILMQ